MKKLRMLSVLAFFIPLVSWAYNVPYSVDFTKSYDGWTVKDANGDGSTWTFDYLSYNGMYAGGMSGNDDWLISPSISLEEGKTYSVTVYKYFEGTPYADDVIGFYLGSGEDVDSYDDVAVLNLDIEGGIKPDVIDFKVGVSGDYHLAFRNKCHGFGSVWYISGIDIVEKEESSGNDGGFAKDFSQDRTLDGWTVIDGNGDGVMWGFSDGAAGVSLPMSVSYQADDWLISPEIPGLSAGKNYILRFTMSAQGGFDSEKVSFFLGSAASAEAMTRLVSSEDIVQGKDSTYIYKITLDDASLNRIGLHGYSQPFGGMVSLLSVELKESAGVQPVSPSDFMAESDFNEKTVRLAWKNPVKDMEGIDISMPVNINIYRNGSIVATVQGSAGEIMTYVDSPEPFSGDVVYGVEAWCESGNVGPVSETSVTLDDFQGEAKSYQAWGGTDNRSFEEWTVNNVDEYATFEYVSYNNSYEIGMKSSRNDWITSPAIQLVSNRRYVIKADIRTSISFGSSFVLTLSDSAEPGSGKVIKEFEALGNGILTYETDQFSVDSDGDYYIGLQCTGSETTTSVLKIEVLYYENGTPQRTIPYTESFGDESAISDWYSEGTASFTVDEFESLDGNALVASAADGGSGIIFTPVMRMAAGLTYAIDFDYGIAGSGAKFEAYVATGRHGNEIIDTTRTVLDGSGRTRMLFTPDKTTTYCIAFMFDSEGQTAVAALDNLEVGSVVYASLPYSENFDGYAVGDSPDGWTGTKASDDGEGVAAVISGVASTPTFAHTETYESYDIMFSVKNNTGPLVINVTDGEVTKTVAELDGTYGQWRQFRLPIPKLYDDKPFDFRVTFECAEAMLDSVSVVYADRDVIPSAPLNFICNKSFMGDTWEMSWYNPEVDVDGNKINKQVTVSVYRDGVEMASVTGNPGEAVSTSVPCDDNWLNGAMIFRAVASCEGVVGKAVTNVLREDVGTLYKIETAAFDFSDDETWNVSGWNGDGGAMVTTTDNSRMSSPALDLEGGKRYVVAYRFITSPDSPASLSVALRSADGDYAQSQDFESLYLGAEQGGGFPEFIFITDSLPHDGQYNIDIVASDVEGSVSMSSVVISELVEYPGTCAIPYYADFDDEAVADGSMLPNWDVVSTNNTSLWRLIDISERLSGAASGRRALVADDTGFAGRADYVYTPYFVFEDGKSYTLSFKYFIEGNNSSLEFVYAYSPSAKSDEYVVLTDLVKTDGGWHTYTLPLVPENGDMNVTFGFIALSDKSNDGMVAVDDFSIVEGTGTGIGVTGRADGIGFSGGMLSVPDGCRRVEVYGLSGNLLWASSVEGSLSLPRSIGGVCLVKAVMDDGSSVSAKIVVR